MRGDYPSSLLIKSYTNMLANADDGSLSTKVKSLPLTRLAIALSLKISVNKVQMSRRSQNIVTCIVICDCFFQKQSSRLTPISGLYPFLTRNVRFLTLFFRRSSVHLGTFRGKKKGKTKNDPGIGTRY